MVTNRGGNHTITLLFHIETYLVFADNRWSLSILFLILALILAMVLALKLLKHIIYLIHIFIWIADLLLIRLLSIKTDSHLTLGEGLVHLQFYTVYVELLSVALYFLSFVCNSIWSFDLLVFQWDSYRILHLVLLHIVVSLSQLDWALRVIETKLLLLDGVRILTLAAT
jgi:hypothetical protein